MMRMRCEIVRDFPNYIYLSELTDRHYSSAYVLSHVAHLTAESNTRNRDTLTHHWTKRNNITRRNAAAKTRDRSIHPATNVKAVTVRSRYRSRVLRILPCYAGYSAMSIPAQLSLTPNAEAIINSATQRSERAAHLSKKNNWPARTTASKMFIQTKLSSFTGSPASPCKYYFWCEARAKRFSFCDSFRPSSINMSIGREDLNRLVDWQMREREDWENLRSAQHPTQERGIISLAESTLLSSSALRCIGSRQWPFLLGSREGNGKSIIQTQKVPERKK